MNEIETLMKTLLEQEKQRADLNTEKKKLKERQDPVRPTYFECLEDAQAWVEEQNANADQVKKVTEELTEINKAILSTETALKKAIPILNCWIKAEVDGKVYGIGKYLDAWGGTHAEISFDEWCDEMKDNPPRNRLEYN